MFHTDLAAKLVEARPDTRLPKLCAGRQGPYLRSLDHLGRSSEVKEIKSFKKTKIGINRPKDRWTKQVVESRACD